MATILLITVGGSPQPIVTAIQALEPDRIIFICSSGPRGSLSQIIGEGTPCEVRRGTEIIAQWPNIPTHLGLGDRFNPETDLVQLENPDDLGECYRCITEKVNEIQTTNPDARIYADYTGGTKTMSLALGAVALDYGLSLYLTTSTTRENLIKVERGESTERAATTLVTVERTLNQILPMLLEQYHYPAAIAQLKSLLQSLELPPEQRQRIRTLITIARALDAWDRFDHREAWSHLETQMKHLKSLGLFLKRVIASRAAIDSTFEGTDGIRGHGYEIVQDLLLNADRRAAQARYDDAVGRIYRALELLVQIRLKQAYGIQTGDVDLMKLPENLRPKYDQKRSPYSHKIQLALRDSYELLSQLSDDPLGKLYRERAEAIYDTLQIRNNSLFAHGFQPISTSEYRRVVDILKTFIKEAIVSVTPTQKHGDPEQFPKNFSGF